MATTEEHIDLRLGDLGGTACTVGGAIIRLEDGSGPMLAPPPTPTCRPEEFRGVVLAPWPNRTPPRYEFGGSRHELEVSEPSTGSALHGLVARRSWEVTALEPHRIEMRASLSGEQGYPFPLQVVVTYELQAGGMTARIVAVNIGDEPAPVGLGAHPYMAAGCAVDETELRLPADAVRVVPATGDARLVPVDHTSYDFRRNRSMRATRLDHAFTELTRSADDTVEASIRCADRTVTLVGGSTVDWLMVFTSDTLGGRARRAGIAIEPMTCGPGALASDRGIGVLDPSAKTHLEWSIMATSGSSR